jgi:hypothetical protein
MGNFKQSATAESAAEVLALRTGLTAVVDQSESAFAAPLISVGNCTTTNAGVQIAVQAQRGTVTSTEPGWKALPGFGSVDQPVYTGTVFKLTYELGAAPLSYYVAPALIMQVVGELVRRGGTVELWQIANGNAPTAANIAAQGTLVGTFNSNLYYPIQGRV